MLRSWKKPVEWPSRIDVVQQGRNGEVVVELYAGRVDMSGEMAEGESTAMQPEGQPHDGAYEYVVTTSTSRSGLPGFTERVGPYHTDMPAKFIPGLICRADPSRAPAPVVV
jgi:hypothetical protein